MKSTAKSLLKITRVAARRWYHKDPFMQSAVIAYYSIFSMPGLLVMVIAIATIFFKRDAITGHVYNQVSAIMGPATAQQVQDMIITAGNTDKSILATIIGLLTILIGATGVFVELQKALNIIWEVKAKPRKAIFTLLRTRLFSFGLILSVGFLLLISLAVTTILAAISTWALSHWPPILLIIFHAVDFTISFAVIMFLFALIFKILPDAKIKWNHVWVGSIVTALLFLLGKTAIGFYLSQTNPASQYGAAGSVVLILLWVSYSSMILFYGAEFTRAYADHYSGKIHPTAVAVKAHGREK